MFNNILIIFPTNIGDTVIALPTLDKLKGSYPNSKITAIASIKTKELLSRNTAINEVIVFDKGWDFLKKAKFSFSLKGKYDLVIDLKHSFIPIIVGGKTTSIFRFQNKREHAKESYLNLVRNFIKTNDYKSDFLLTEEEILKWKNFKIPSSLFFAFTSNDRRKNYPYELAKEVIENLRRDFSIVILGIDKDRQFYKDILNLNGVIDLVGKTKLHEVFYLLKKYALLLVSVDCGILHIGSFLNISTIALFGPTDERRYGPWGKNSIILRNTNLDCKICKRHKCGLKYQCMSIEPKLIIETIKNFFNKNLNCNNLIIV